jgi:sorbitol-specific phosphotransferase system component IIA
VGWLIQVINSQSPTRELGTQAYQQLLEIGFVSTPFPS